MALIKCNECGHTISDKAESCPNCGYPVRLLMEQQQEKTEKSVKTHFTAGTEKKETVNENLQPRQKNSKKGILIAAVVVVVIGCGIFAMLNGQQQDKRSEITEQFANNVQKYEKLNNFHEGLAAVQHNGLWGYIDKEGNEVIPCQYESAEDFNNSRAIVSKGGLYGCIDTKGNEVVPFEYGWIHHYTDYFTVNKDYKNIHGCGYLDNEGKEIAPCIYSAISSFSDGLSRVRKDDLYGFIDKQGKEVIPCKYEYAEVFSDGLALIEREGLYGFIDKQGNEVIPCKYTYAHSFSEGLAAIQMADADGISKVGYIDSKGNETIHCIYNVADGMHPFSKGIAVVMDEQGFLGGVDARGKEILPFVYGDIQVFDNVIVTREATSQSYRLLDKTGNEISTSVYDAIYPSDSGLIIVVKDGKSGFINQEGKEVIPLTFDAYFDEYSDAGWVAGCNPFVEGVSIVRLNGKYGAIDEQGNEVVPYIYDEIWDFSEGFAVAKIGDKWGYIDTKGNNTLSQTGMNGVKTQNEQQSPKQIQANSADRVEAENTHSQIVGTYEFQVHIPNMDNVVTAYSFDNGFTKERRQIGTIDGVEYMVVHPDMRVSILEPGDRKKYVGTVNEVVEGVFTVKCSNDDGKFGHGYILYESGREIGTSGNNYGGYGVFVVDTKNHRVYKTVEEYKGSDISDTEHLMYDSFTPTVRTSNTTEWQRNYFDQYKDDYED